jgi:hypothetical protein
MIPAQQHACIQWAWDDTGGTNGAGLGSVAGTFLKFLRRFCGLFDVGMKLEFVSQAAFHCVRALLERLQAVGFRLRVEVAAAQEEISAIEE